MSCECVMVVTKPRARGREMPGVDSKSVEYKIWAQIRFRCRTFYADKGILISREWDEDFRKFLSDMGPRPSSIHSVDRIDNSLGYCKHNCRWATPFEQVMNRSITKKNKQWPCGLAYDASKKSFVLRLGSGASRHIADFSTEEFAVALAGIHEAIENPEMSRRDLLNRAAEILRGLEKTVNVKGPEAEL